jgi:hypothetical protein
MSAEMAELGARMEAVIGDLTPDLDESVTQQLLSRIAKRVEAGWQGVADPSKGSESLVRAILTSVIPNLAAGDELHAMVGPTLEQMALTNEWLSDPNSVLHTADPNAALTLFNGVPGHFGQTVTAAEAREVTDDPWQAAMETDTVTADSLPLLGSRRAEHYCVP